MAYLCVPGQWCGECGLIAVTPGDYLCSHCRREFGCPTVIWKIKAGHQWRMLLISEFEDWSYLMTATRPKVWQVASHAIIKSNGP